MSNNPNDNVTCITNNRIKITVKIIIKTTAIDRRTSNKIKINRRIMNIQFKM